MEDINNTKLMEEVNPVFTTAQACLLVMAEAGDEDAKKLVTKLGFDREISNIDKDALTEMEKFQRMKSVPGFLTMVEARFTASSNLILSYPDRTVVDLPCGYTPRGLQMAKKGFTYYGFDLPPVISATAPACYEMYQGEVPPSYTAVDATNYESMRAALDHAKGELFITTEGLLMYLTQSELEEVFCNISRLLAEFGGTWVTTDNMIVSTHERIKQAISPDKVSSAAAAKASQSENIFFDPAQAEDFVKRMGFSLEKIPVYDYLPDQLNTLSQYPENTQADVRNAFKHMYFWVMQIYETAKNKNADNNKEFQITSRRTEHVQFVALQGRLDTLTAPQLLSLYLQENENSKADNIDIDMKDLDYISSAGLRVLLIMIKNRPENGRVTVYNLKPSVESILRTSGFEDILCIRSTSV